ncbi:soluble NSF attachment protein [Powellomyces hirtus]|nr:soluble NSF attachment protein [Powellomyces hirtus]
MDAGEKARNKKTLFGKQKPDWDMAVQNFEAAATCFKNARAYDYCVEAYVKAAEGHRQLDSLFLAAKALESAATIAGQQLKQPAQSADLYRQTSEFFLAQGSHDRAGEALEKAAKALETTDVNKCIEFYDESCRIYEDENKLRFGVDTFKRAIGVCLRNQRYDKALELSGRLSDAFSKLEQRPNFCKQALSSIVILLAKGDEAGADNHLAMLAGQHGFAQSEEGGIAQALIEGMQNGDQEALNGALKRTAVQFLDNEIARTARELKAPAGRGPGQKSQPPPEKPASEAVKQLQDEIEEEGFL